MPKNSYYLLLLASGLYFKLSLANNTYTPMIAKLQPLQESFGEIVSIPKLNQSANHLVESSGLMKQTQESQTLISLAFESSAKNIIHRENLSPDIITLMTNGKLQPNSYPVYQNINYLCLKSKDSAEIFTPLAVLEPAQKKQISYSCLKNNTVNSHYNLNSQTNLVTLAVESSWLPSASISITTNNGIVYPDSVLSANTTLYQLFLSQTASQGIPNFNPAINFQNQMSTNFGSLSNTGSYSTQNSFNRSQTYWQTDFPSQMTSLILGDSNSYPGTWGNSVFYGGVHYGSNLVLQPLSVFSAMPVIQGQAAVPSTAQLLLNNRTPIGNVEIPAGPFNISNIPVLNGNGTVTMLLKDNAGVAYSQVTIPFYANQSILKEGTYQYRYDMGLPNDNLGGWNMGYQESESFLSSDHLYGITNNYSIDLHSELQPTSLYDLGLSHNFLVYNQLVANLTTAISTSQQWGIGGLLAIGLSRQATNGQSISYGYQLTLTTAQFQQLGIVSQTGQDYPLQQTIFLSVPVSKTSSISLGANYQSQINYGNSSTYNSTFLWQIIPSLGLNLTTMLTSQPDSPNSLSLLANFNYIFNSSSSIQSGLQNVQQDDTSTYSSITQFQYNDPTNTWGYNLGATASPGNQSIANNNDGETAGSGGGFYNFKNFNVLANSTFQDAENYTFLGSVQGSLILSGAGVNLGRYSNMSYILVTVGNFANVSVKLNGSFIGRTDADGNYMVPNVQSYLPQKVSIDVNDLPMNYEVANNEYSVTVPLNGGIEVDFNPVHYIPALVHLKTSTTSYVPTGTQVEVHQQTAESSTEDSVVVDNGMVQILKYTRDKSYYISYSDSKGRYKCPLLIKPGQDSDAYSIKIEDSLCQKQF